MRPVQTDQRIHVLDIARGLAIFGILLINMTFYNTSLQAIQWQISLWTDPLNEATRTVLFLLADGKFLAIFAFLFGYGAVLLRDRTLQKGRKFGPLYVRRLVALLVFGLIHGWFIWFGDILLHYALLGLALMAFLSRKPRTLVIWAIGLLALMPVLLLAGGGGDMTPDPEFQQLIHEAVARDTAVYSSGTYAEITLQRRIDWASSAMNQVLFYPQILGLFLLGAYFAKRKVLHDVTENKDLLKRLAVWTGVLGSLFTFLPHVLASIGLSETSGTQLDVLQILVGGPLLGLFYICALALLTQRASWQRVLMPLASVGRTAFTNYIAQSVICTLLFYGYGLGLYGKVSPLVGLVLSVLLFTLQTVISALWLKRFRMGPLEWLWRAVTYLTVPPLVRRGEGEYQGAPRSA